LQTIIIIIIMANMTNIPNGNVQLKPMLRKSPVHDQNRKISASGANGVSNGSVSNGGGAGAQFARESSPPTIRQKKNVRFAESISGSTSGYSSCDLESVTYLLNNPNLQYHHLLQMNPSTKYYSVPGSQVTGAVTTATNPQYPMVFMPTTPPPPPSPTDVGTPQLPSIVKSPLDGATTEAQHFFPQSPPKNHEFGHPRHRQTSPSGRSQPQFLSARYPDWESKSGHQQRLTPPSTPPLGQPVFTKPANDIRPLTPSAQNAGNFPQMNHVTVNPANQFNSCHRHVQPTVLYNQATQYPHNLMLSPPTPSVLYSPLPSNVTPSTSKTFDASTCNSTPALNCSNQISQMNSTNFNLNNIINNNSNNNNNNNNNLFLVNEEIQSQRRARWVSLIHQCRPYLETLTNEARFICICQLSMYC
jgi:hypothetical protein